MSEAKWVETVNGMSDAERDAYLARYYESAEADSYRPWRSQIIPSADMNGNTVTESSDESDESAGRVAAFFDTLREWQAANKLRFDLVTFVSAMSSVPVNSTTGKPDMTTLGEQLGVTRQTALYKYNNYSKKYASEVKRIATEHGIG